MDGTMRDNESKFELIEKYFDGRLSAAERSVFDQLMATDQEFISDVDDYRKLTAFTDFLDEEILLKGLDLSLTNKKTNSNKHQLVANAPLNQKDQRATVKPIFFPRRVSNRYAAAIALLFVSLVAVSLMFSNIDWNQTSSSKNSKVLTVEYERKDSKPTKIPEKTAKTVTEKKPKATQEMAFLATNFEVNDTFEKLILEQSSVLKNRSENQSKLKFEIIQPQKTPSVGNEMLIQWKSNDASVENITVKVYNNKNQIMKTYNFPNKSGKTTLNTQSLKQGLYYWRVMSTETEEVLFIGKFTKKQ
ncbi:hypothetical protein M23134_03499 [Microscilla marina ATCC 23134]|uniref:Uncharacterized protein n=2 Tax=Microscilla marina TaxID=1027 RepID=A1ZN57_MICM2|nr:hypothetical protein M23134_03499 [Microscilla marina ATCC 23134]